MSQNLGCRNSYENVPTIKSVRKSINHRFAGIPHALLRTYEMIALISSSVLGQVLIWRPIRSSKSFFAYFLN
ncbi:hypothetical protein FFZ96_09650, partial [Leptospira borgpetersenii]